MRHPGPVLGGLRGRVPVGWTGAPTWLDAAGTCGDAGGSAVSAECRIIAAIPLYSGGQSLGKTFSLFPHDCPECGLRDFPWIFRERITSDTGT
jgi:hypothetical protein